MDFFSWITRTILVLALAAMMVARPASSRRLWDTILSDFRLHQMARVLESNQLTKVFEGENITVYLPTSNAYFFFDGSPYGIKKDDDETWEQLLIYASHWGRHVLASLPTEGRIASRLEPRLALYINTFYTRNGRVTTVNGARIVQADIQCDNGILHIVDRVIAPLARQMTIAQYLESPALPNLSFNAIILAAVVVPDLTRKTNQTDSTFTSFSPNDSYLYPMPDYGKDPLFNNFTLLRDVYQAHIIQNRSLFLPTHATELMTQNALVGEIRFYSVRGQLYICNHMVHAKVILPNLATANGVVHVIDNLLHYVYHNALQMVNAREDTRIIAQILKQAPESILNKLSNDTVSLFLPSDWAFSKVPLYWQTALIEQEHNAHLAQVLMNHIVVGSVLDGSRLYHGQKLKTMNNKTLTVLEYDSEGNRDFHIESGDVHSRVEIMDIGVTNGVIHLVSNLLSSPDFTVWDAVSDIPELSRLHNLIATNFQEVRNLLGMPTQGYLTAFLPSNTVLEEATDFLNSMLLNSPGKLLMGLKGHLVPGYISSSVVDEKRILTSLANNTVIILPKQGYSEMYIKGGHVTAKVTLSDVYCSNGVLHVIDHVLHLATRTVKDEMASRSDMGYVMTLFDTLANELGFDLGSKGDNFTVFVPNNVAFSHLPWKTIDTLMKDIPWTKNVLRSHVVIGEARTLDQIETCSSLKSEHSILHILKENGEDPEGCHVDLPKKEEGMVDEKMLKTYIVGNNMRAQVLVPNLPVLNGWIHIIDRLLTVPYISVSEAMKKHPELTLFHELMSPLPEYHRLMTSPLRNVTIFVPSSRYIRILRQEQVRRMKNSMDVLRKLFQGHVIPNVRLDEEFLRQFPEQNFISRSSYNVTFKISTQPSQMYVNVGFDSQTIDPVARAFGCTDGVLYVVDGFLNYSPFTVLDRLKREPGLSRSFEVMKKLVPDHDLHMLDDPDLTFTFLMPDDNALDSFNYHQLLRLQSLPAKEQYETFWRHTINGSALLQEDFRANQETVLDDLMAPEVTVRLVDDNVIFQYHNVESRVTKWNLIASNGVIHTLNHFLYDVKPTTPQPISSTESLPRDGTRSPDPLKDGGGVRNGVGRGAVVPSWCVVLVLVLQILRIR